MSLQKLCHLNWISAFEPIQVNWMLFYHTFQYPHESPLHFLKPKGMILFNKKYV